MVLSKSINSIHAYFGRKSDVPGGGEVANISYDKVSSELVITAKINRILIFPVLTRSRLVYGTTWSSGSTIQKKMMMIIVMSVMMITIVVQIMLLTTFRDPCA